MWYYIISAARRIKRNKLNSIVKILGIAIALSMLLFITVYVAHETSYDNHIDGVENTYRVVRNWQKSDVYDPSTPASLLCELKNTFAEIESGTRLYFLFDNVISFQDKTVHEDATFGVDSSFVQTFNFRLLQGDARTALNSPGTVVISQSKSKLFFGNANPLGKSLEFEGKDFNAQNKTFIITGVYADYPSNSHFRPNYLVSLKSFKIYSRKENNNHSLMTYLRLKKGANKQLFESKLPNFLKLFYGAEYYNYAQMTYRLQPVTKIHLDTWVYPYGYETGQGDSRTLYVFPLLGLLILIIAGINYFNLTIAEGYQSINTFGINKIMGANKHYYFKSFFVESILLIGLSLILTFWLGVGLLAKFGTMMDRELSFYFFKKPTVLMFSGLLVAGFILFTSAIPAFIFSRKRLQNFISTRKTIPFKNNPLQQISQMLQFGICIFFIIASIITYKQLLFVTTETNSTMKTDNVLVIENTRYLENQRDAFKQELLKLTCVKSVSVCNAAPGFTDFSNWGYPVDKALENVNVSVFECDPDYLKTLNIALAKGRFLYPESQNDQSSMVLNEAAIKKLGWEKDPIGKRYHVGKDFTVVGIARDVHYEALQYQILPQAYVPNRHKNSASKVIIKLETKNTAESIRQINSLWAKFVPHRDMYYKFIDDEFAKWYKTEQRTARLAVILSVIAILLSNLGLFAFILFKIQRRIKEIGIRKVNGARITEILTMLNKDFIKWVVIAFFIACPIAWYAMHKWLQNFAYKTELSWWVFGAAGIVAVAVALLTVSWQSWRAATRNPVESLRYE